MMKNKQSSPMSFLTTAAAGILILSVCLIGAADMMDGIQYFYGEYRN